MTKENYKKRGGLAKMFPNHHSSAARPFKSHSGTPKYARLKNAYSTVQTKTTRLLK